MHSRAAGDASESGLIKSVQLLNDVKKYRAAYPKLFEIKFNSTNKYQIGIHDQTKDGDSRPLLVMKVRDRAAVVLTCRLQRSSSAHRLTGPVHALLPSTYDTTAVLAQGFQGALLHSAGRPQAVRWQPCPSCSQPEKPYDVALLVPLSTWPFVPLCFRQGAPERVWAISSKLLINGREVPKTPELEARFNTAYEALGALGERVLGFAYRNLDGVPHSHPWTDQPAPNFPTGELVFVGLLSLIDPPRHGVPEVRCDVAVAGRVAGCAAVYVFPRCVPGSRCGHVRWCGQHGAWGATAGPEVRDLLRLGPSMQDFSGLSCGGLDAVL